MVEGQGVVTHLPSDGTRRELVAVPFLVRFTVAHGDDGPEPTLIVKGCSLQLKYLVLQSQVTLVVMRLSDGRVAYALRIDDDPIHPAYWWSTVSEQGEIDAINAIADGHAAAIHLFNESVANMASTYVIFDRASAKGLAEIAKSAVLSDIEPIAETRDEVDTVLDSVRTRTPPPFTITSVGRCLNTWQELTSYYISNTLDVLRLSLFDGNEGGQQETLAAWLMDALHSDSAYPSPQVLFGSKHRELCDVLMIGSFGCFFLESKALTILTRKSLPTRVKLATDVEKHVAKGARQLGGALRTIGAGAEVSTREGIRLAPKTKSPPHCIVLVPDLSLMGRSTRFGGDFLRGWTAEHQAFLHVLDPAELFTLAQAGAMLSARSSRFSTRDCFDAHLLTRFKAALEHPTPDFRLLLRIEEEVTSDGRSNPSVDQPESPNSHSLTSQPMLPLSPSVTADARAPWERPRRQPASQQCVNSDGLDRIRPTLLKGVAASEAAWECGHVDGIAARRLGLHDYRVGPHWFILLQNAAQFSNVDARLLQDRQRQPGAEHLASMNRDRHTTAAFGVAQLDVRTALHDDGPPRRWSPRTSSAPVRRGRQGTAPDGSCQTARYARKYIGNHIRGREGFGSSAATNGGALHLSPVVPLELAVGHYL
jgi:hypothetical protein